MKHNGSKLTLQIVSELLWPLWGRAKEFVKLRGKKFTSERHHYSVRYIQCVQTLLVSHVYI